MKGFHTDNFTFNKRSRTITRIGIRPIIIFHLNRLKQSLDWTVKLTVIPGASKASQAEQNGLAMNLSLSRSELNSIAELSEQFT